MRADLRNRRSPASGLIVPTAEIEAYFAAGFRLADEPGCGGASMSPPDASHRVPHKKTGRSGHREPVKNDFDNARDSRTLRVAQ
jgi:hypothetical protein